MRIRTTRFERHVRSAASPAVPISATSPGIRGHDVSSDPGDQRMGVLVRYSTVDDCPETLRPERLACAAAAWFRSLNDGPPSLCYIGLWPHWEVV